MELSTVAQVHFAAYCDGLLSNKNVRAFYRLSLTIMLTAQPTRSGRIVFRRSNDWLPVFTSTKRQRSQALDRRGRAKGVSRFGRYFGDAQYCCRIIETARAETGSAIINKA
ncbi:hypothetical protein [Neorhizobium tomejilense]|jgi:hypothetical protein|uniref:hypothetical protein n=1 Tax=Neorhizobium tomejilense TaxID=2093828 RepID=UPI000CF8FC34|nr:hypothetical protein [Neorhizobium tomejilense]